MKQKILIVDDKPENLFTLEEFILEHLDVEVIQAENGNDALRHFLHHQFALAILDVQMPEMDGYELAKYIRSRNESRSTPIVFLSAVFSDDFHVFKGYDSGGVDFITKPFNPQLLLNKVRFFIRLKEEELKRKAVEDNLQELVAERTKELLQAKVEAEKANQAKSNFLATMSHEIRTPLHALLGMANLLGETRLNGKQKDYINTIQGAGKMLVSIINDILDFSKIEAGKMEIENIDIEFNNVIGMIVDIYRRKACDSEIQLNFENHLTSPLYVKGDSVRIRQILNNLLSNAMKFTEKGSITVNADYTELSDSELNLILKVSDTGIGIPSDKMKSLFAPFTQVDNSISRRYGGTGLGLSITKSLLEEMNGKISVQSTKGKGTTFTISLILEKGNPTEPKQDNSPKSQWAGRIIKKDSVNILIAEDGEFNKVLIKEMLDSLKSTYEIVENGKIAVEMIKKNDYDLILMDCQMPEMDGFEATRQIRKLTGKTDIPIIALTANAVKGTREKCLNAGMNDYISKPFTKKQLFDKIAQFYQVAGILIDDIPSLEKDYKNENISSKDLKKFYSEMGEETYTILSCLIDLIPDNIQKISEQYRKGLYKELSETCHQLKGSSATVGAHSLSKKCDKIAHYMDKMDEKELENTVENVVEMLSCLKEELTFICENKKLAEL